MPIFVICKAHNHFCQGIENERSFTEEGLKCGLSSRMIPDCVCTANRPSIINITGGAVDAWPTGLP